MTSITTIEIELNGERKSFPADLTIADLLLQLDVKTKAIAVEVNKQIVPSDQFAETKINSNDELEIVTLVGGG